jgi:hypothetical protein
MTIECKVLVSQKTMTMEEILFTYQLYYIFC